MANSNARIVEKDIMTAVASASAGASDIVDLNGASRFSCQAIYTVSSPVGASITFQGSNKFSTTDTDWSDLQAATSISAGGNTLFEKASSTFRYFRVKKALSSGTVTLQALTLVIGDAQ